MTTSEADFVALTGPHRRELHVHCYRMTGSFEEAEDLVQETLLRAWRRSEDLDDVTHLRAWLYRIATNACLDAIKASGRRVPSLGSLRDIPWLEPYPDAALAPVEEQPDAALIGRETIELTFLAVIQLLPPSQRAVLILRDVLDWSAADVARELELSVPAVNSALQRAKATLREHLPSGRREDWRSPDITAVEQELLDGFIATHESGDVDAALALIADDIRVTMPPLPMLYEGKAEIEGLIRHAADRDVHGAWRLVPTRVNRQPAAASYLRAPGEDVFRAMKLDVLRVEGGLIAEITTFGTQAIARCGLPETLPA